MPPRNPPTMSRLNGRLGGGGSLHHHHPPHHMVDRGDPEFEPSCLVRTPSGNVYIPAGEWFLLILLKLQEMMKTVRWVLEKHIQRLSPMKKINSESTPTPKNPFLLERVKLQVLELMG